MEMERSLPALLFDPERVEELRRTGLLEEESAGNFERLTRPAVSAVGADAGYVSLLSDERQHIRAGVGLPGSLDTRREAPLEDSICAHALDRSDTVAIRDLRADARFADHPVVERTGIRSYVGVPLRTGDGHVLGVFCVVGLEPRDWSDGDVELIEGLAAAAETEIALRRELADRRELESRLRDREEAFRALVENVTDVVTLLDEEGEVLFESPSVEEVLGYGPEELVGRSVFGLIHPEDRESVREAMERALGEPGHRETLEVRFRDADGEWRIVEASARSLPGDSELGAVLTSSRDVTERRRLEESLRVLATAVENVDAGVLITGPELDPPGPEIRYVNRAMSEMTGYGESELVGRTPRLLQGPETDRTALDRLRERLERGEPVEEQTINYRKGGDPYHVRWKITPIFGEGGDVTHFVSVQEDTTEQVERERLLEERVRERTRQLDRSQSEALARLARAAEYRDDETGRHTQRVGALAAALARALERDGTWVELIREAAPLHDVGKIGIPDRILLKPGGLTDEQYRTMKRHTVIGAELLGGGRSDLFRMAERIARSHHERWDGEGYPDGLAGDEIPVSARIVTVADAFDAMTHDRPYRDALARDEALREIEEERGRQFDPRVADALLEEPGLARSG